MDDSSKKSLGEGKAGLIDASLTPSFAPSYSSLRREGQKGQSVA